MAYWPSYDQERRKRYLHPQPEWSALTALSMSPRPGLKARRISGNWPNVPLRNWGWWRPGGIPQMAVSGMGGGSARMSAAQAPTDWTTEKWFPELMNLVYGRIRGGQQDAMNQITGNLGRALGSHLSRTNVAVPVGADALARRYLSPLSQAMETADPTGQMVQAMALAKMLAPGFGAQWGEKSPGYRRLRNPLAQLERYMDRIWGGGR